MSANLPEDTSLFSIFELVLNKEGDVRRNCRGRREETVPISLYDGHLEISGDFEVVSVEMSLLGRVVLDLNPTSFISLIRGQNAAASCHLPKGGCTVWLQW